MPNLPEYMAVWVPPVATGTAYGDNYVSGWYVFQKESPLPGSNAAVSYPTPVAWPTAGSPPASNLALNDQGFVSLNVDAADGGTYVIQFDTLPAGTSGNGGTDGWSDPPQATGIGTLIVDNGTTGSGVGGVEAPVLPDTGTLFPDGQSTLGTNMQFRDASKDGTWTQDGLGLLWDFSSSSIKSEWDSRIGTTGGTFTIVEAGTETPIFSYEWNGTPGFWSGSGTWNFPIGTGAANVGTVPGTNTRVDVYFQ